MQRTATIGFGGLVLVLGMAGLLAGDKQLLDFMNVDLALDIGRLGLAALLLYAAFGRNGDRGIQRSSLLIFAIVYIGLAVIGLLDREVFGLLPSGLSSFDLVFHAGAGLLAVLLASGQDETRVAST